MICIVLGRKQRQERRFRTVIHAIICSIMCSTLIVAAEAGSESSGEKYGDGNVDLWNFERVDAWESEFGGNDEKDGEKKLGRSVNTGDNVEFELFERVDAWEAVFVNEETETVEFTEISESEKMAGALGKPSKGTFTHSLSPHNQSDGLYGDFLKRAELGGHLTVCCLVFLVSICFLVVSLVMTPQRHLGEVSRDDMWLNDVSMLLMRLDEVMQQTVELQETKHVAVCDGASIITSKLSGLSPMIQNWCAFLCIETDYPTLECRLGRITMAKKWFEELRKKCIDDQTISLNSVVPCVEWNTLRNMIDECKEYLEKLGDDCNSDICAAIVRHDIPELLEKMAYAKRFGIQVCEDVEKEKRELMVKDQLRMDTINVLNEAIHSRCIINLSVAVDEAGNR